MLQAPGLRCSPGSVTPRPDGPLTARKVCQAIGAILPEGAIVSDEAITSAAALPASTAGAPRHDWLTLTGGAIGQGLPVAVGAAIACPDRPVIALEADGSAMYTIQSLWTMAREHLDVTVVIFNNRGYGILDVELARIDSQGAGPRSQELLDLRRSGPRFRRARHRARDRIAARRSRRAAHRALEEAIAEPGPHLIEAILPRVSSQRARGPYAARAASSAHQRLQPVPDPLCDHLEVLGTGREWRRHRDRSAPGTDEDSGGAGAQGQRGCDARLPLAGLGCQLDGGHRSHAAPDLGHELVPSKRRERIEQRLLLFASALEQTIALEQGDIRERGRAARGMAGIRRAVPEDWPPGRLPERLGDPLGDHDAAQGEIPAGHPLANTIMSGSTPQRSIPNHVPSRPNAQITASMTSNAPVRRQRSATPSM